MGHILAYKYSIELSKITQLHKNLCFSYQVPYGNTTANNGIIQQHINWHQKMRWLVLSLIYDFAVFDVCLAVNIVYYKLQFFLH